MAEKAGFDVVLHCSSGGYGWLLVPTRRWPGLVEAAGGAWELLGNRCIKWKLAAASHAVN